MCECTLIIEQRTQKPIEISRLPHRFIYHRGGETTTLLEDIPLEGVINYAATHEIKDMYGVKRGYILVFGERDKACEPIQAGSFTLCE